ncbi:FAD-binding oxidoreductase [Myxococcota bacterium]|nr:FAD-binding oxidoreductase [Myxococcota bacterium]
MSETGLGAVAQSSQEILSEDPTASLRRIVPDHEPVAPEDAESESNWGFEDTRFEVDARGHVRLTGDRYALSGAELVDLLPWARELLDLTLDPSHVNPSQYPTPIPPPNPHAAFEEELRRALSGDQLSTDPRVRLRHGHGQTQEEMYAIKYDQIERVPDLVIFPESEADIEAIVAAATRFDVCLIPFGGGTNVSEALLCPRDEERSIVSVDMGRMNRVLWIDPEDHTACIEAGARGRDIQKTLERHGFTIGHEPDSVEFSTLGGWIATHASGMKKNRYGNIEDIVLDLRAITPLGVIGHHAALARESIGTDIRRALFGSEGNFGIVTRATVRIRPIPEVQKFGSVLFHSFEDGFAFVRDVERELSEERLQPSSIRLVDNVQFQFSQALKPKPTGWKAYRSALERWWVTGPLGYDPQEMVACTLVFEGTADEVRLQEKRLYAIAKRHRGMKGGAANGERGYQLTFAIAYIRDFMMKHFILAESFETTVPWSQALDLCRNTKQRLWQEHAKHGLPGKPFVTCRITQIYNTGVCVYFYFGHSYQGIEDPTGTYAEIERAARDEILRNGGSLSHHHGIGKLRRDFLPLVKSEANLEATRRFKHALDPANVFGASNQ